MLERESPNFDARTVAIDLVVLHYTGMQDAETALRRLTDPAPRAGAYPGPWQAADTDPDTELARVSAHYVVDEQGRVHRLVPEEMRAWHAGQSRWEGRKDTNDRAIGIEIVNGGHDFGLPAYPEAQIEGVIGLVRDILERRGLSPWRVVGHSDVAPARKADPGEHFPWAQLAKGGVAVVAPEASVPPLAGDVGAAETLAQARRDLIAIGYGVDLTGDIEADIRTVVTAFQRRFRPGRIDGALDPETVALLGAVAAVAARARAAAS